MLSSPYVDANQVSSTYKSAREWWRKVNQKATFYNKALSSVAKQVSKFMNELWEAGREDAIETTLIKYSAVIEPWAEAVSEKMLADVFLQDEKAWMQHSQRMARAMQVELHTMPQGEIIRQLRAKQVRLIKSLPLEAAQQAHDLAFEAASQTGVRKEVIAAKIKQLGEITEARALLIARTEISTSHEIIQQARAEWIGSEGYIWRTLRNRLVRKEHVELEGTFHRWDTPPIAERNGARHHPGCFPNCRCYSEVVLPAKYNLKVK